MTSGRVAAAATSAAAPWGLVPGPADGGGVRATIREYRDGNPRLTAILDDNPTGSSQGTLVTIMRWQTWLVGCAG